MKRIVGVLFLLSFISLSYAQVNPHAIGVRLGGDGDVNGAEISYQHGLSDANRLEFDLGFGSNKNHSRMFLIGMYHWDWNLTDGLNWYVGPGAGIGFYRWDNSSDYVNVAIGGQIGLEYDFQAKGAPILLSLDARPMWDFLGDHSGFGWGASLGIRYIW